MNNKVCMEIKCLSSMIRKNIDNTETFKNNPYLTNVMGWTMGYVYHHNMEGKDIFQKDIEKDFHIGRSTATELLQTMEQSGYLFREVSTSDKRLKRIVLTEKALELQKEVYRSIKAVEDLAVKDFSEEELSELCSYLERIKKNLGKEEEIK